MPNGNSTRLLRRPYSSLARRFRPCSSTIGRRWTGLPVPPNCTLSKEPVICLRGPGEEAKLQLWQASGLATTSAGKDPAERYFVQREWASSGYWAVGSPTIPHHPQTANRVDSTTTKSGSLRSSSLRRWDTAHRGQLRSCRSGGIRTPVVAASFARRAHAIQC